ncbi:MAG TPA: CaiB/BaiF CoA-transferase family protein [Steroidobacteraceae bacterium]|nr:CaiB/BaiF CoA-transferase family protein [Steroidobacteraceae bacterium]
MHHNSPSPPGPLAGIRVLEVGQLLAGPFAACVLGYFGAEVIKIEPLGGDPLRNWRVLRDGTSLWWYSLARNKKSVAIDLQKAGGRALIKQLAGTSDVLIENFKPGTMEKWGLGPEDLKAIRPNLIYSRVSGYGQTGPYASRPGFASVCEAVGGLRYINGFPGGPPVRPNLSLGDTLAGLHAVIGILLALVAQGRKRADGQVVDVAIYESVFNVLEGVVPEFDGAGVVRGPSGSTITGIVPSNTYVCADGKYVVIGANGDSLFQRLMRAIGHPDMADDPRLANNAGRVIHEQEIDAVISAWTRAHDSHAVIKTLDKISVPGGPIYSVADMASDPHFQARGLFEAVNADGHPLKIPAITPKLSETPGATRWAGPKIGEHTDEVLKGLLQLDAAEVQRLREEKVVG